MSKILTITVPSYHTEKYMDSCLPTLLDKRINADLEILIVNDGSTDGTLEKARTYEAKFPDTIRVIDKENGGHGSTINKGIAFATGRYFKVVDGDDWVNTDQLVNLVQDLKSVDADIVVSPYQDHNMDNGAVETQDYPNIVPNQVISYDELLQKGGRLPMMHATTFKTSLLRDNQVVIDEKMFYVDMEYIIFPMRFLETAVYLPHQVYCYRMGTAEQSINPANFIKNREMHRQVTYQLIRTYNLLSKERPSAYRTHVLKQQLLTTEIPLDSRICLAMDDVTAGKAEFFRYKATVDELNSDLWPAIPKRLVKLLPIAKGLFFGLLKRYKKGNVW